MAPLASMAGLVASSLISQSMPTTSLRLHSSRQSLDFRSIRAIQPFTALGLSRTSFIHSTLAALFSNRLRQLLQQSQLQAAFSLEGTIAAHPACTATLPQD
mmetsp:Transcript_830/g.2514  ORF Transcript_830/g.2514 Transcript_830/m.2514 type:complete len:101 (+) Transcript_830:1935-2237(+)